jgi:hypothetical protein
MNTYKATEHDPMSRDIICSWGLALALSFVILLVAQLWGL